MSSHSNRPRIVGVASAMPAHVVEQDEARAFAGAHFAPHIAELPRLLSVFERVEVQRRHLCTPLEWLARQRGLRAMADEHLRHAEALSATAARRALARCGFEPGAVDHILFVSTTGFATPSIDARLIDRLDLRPDVHRLPSFGLGCAGGAVGLAHAARVLRGAPRGVLLLINAELCSLTFLPADYSKSNLVATALFGDAVTAAVVCGGEVDRPGLEVLDDAQWLWPDTLDVMGWNLVEHGLQVVFSRRIPAIVRERMAPRVHEFLARSGASLGDVRHVLAHPGGPRVLSAYADTLELDPAQLALTREVLRVAGNCSSASVMLVVERFLERADYDPGDLAWLTALGPGFTAAQVLLRC